MLLGGVRAGLSSAPPAERRVPGRARGYLASMLASRPLDDLLPVGPSAEVHDHARRLLAHQGLPVDEVVRVDADSVLYVSRAGRPRTAWLQLDRAALVIHDEPGFSAQAPA